MRNKIMTKALAVALSASMAFSLSSAMSLSTAMAATKTAPAFVHDAKFTVVAGGVAKPFKLNKKTRKAGWKIVGTPKVTNTDKATASVTDSKLSVIIIPAESYEFAEGVKKVQTRVKVKVRKNNKKSTQKTLKRKVVLKNPNATESVAQVNLTGATQTKYDTAVLTFDGEYTLPTETAVEAVTINGSEKAATSVTIAADKKSATVVFGFAEDTEYTFAVNGANGTASFTTGKYAVVKLDAPETKSVSAGEDHPIEYKLLAENDVDVTAYSNYSDFVTIDVDGEQEEYNADPVKPTIKFDAEGQKSTVKFSFNNTVDPELTAQTVYTSTKAVATAADARWSNNYLRKWYLVDNSDSELKMFNGQEQRVFFYAKKADGSAVEFSDMEVKSSNESVATATISLQDSSKWAIIDVTAAGNGSTTLTVVGYEYKGTETVQAEYTYKVTVTEFNNNISTFNTDISTVTLYNGGYGNQKQVELQAKNSLGDLVDASYEVTVTKGSDDYTDAFMSFYEFVGEEGTLKELQPSGQTTSNPGTVDASANKITLNAAGMPEGSYKAVITVNGESGSNSKEIKKTINIRVVDVLSYVYDKDWGWDKVTVSGNDIWFIDGTVKDKLSGSFKVETQNLYIEDNQTKTNAKLMLVAYLSGKPIGYVDEDGIVGIGTGADVALQKMLYSAGAKGVTSPYYNVSGNYIGENYVENWDDVDLGLLQFYVYSGSKYYNSCDNDGWLYLGWNARNPQKSIYTTKSLAEGFNLDTIADNNNGAYWDYSVRVSIFDEDYVRPYFFSGTSDKNLGLAKAGTYNVVFYYGSDDQFAGDKDTVAAFGKGKQIGGTGKFTVSYNLTIPTLSYDASATAGKYAVSNTELLRETGENSIVKLYLADKDAKISKITVAGEANPASSNLYTEVNDGISKGDKILGVCVQNYVGGYWSGDDTDWDPITFEWDWGGNLDHGKAYDNWSTWRSYELINFVIEKTTTITA